MKKHKLNQLLFSLSTIILTFAIIMPCSVKANQIGNYELSLSFAPEKNQLIGTAKISIPPGEGVQLFLNDLSVTGSLLRAESGREYALSQTDEMISLKPEQESRVLFLSYSYSTNGNSTDLISSKGISLTGNWFPVPANPMLFRITATLPEHFSAIVEADRFPLEQNGNQVQAEYSTPTTALHFTAGPYILQKLLVRDKFYVYTMFFKEDQELAAEYLAAAKNYLLKYENSIGPFPYNHYAIVANRLPTGYGIPTYTLIGQMVLRLPFISSSSLGHEIVHSWFGNSVEVDYQSGNWCEGLTTFLADQDNKEEIGEGVIYRKEAVTKYLNYATDSAPISLGEFRSASHTQAMAEAKRAVGYNRGSMFFHELQQHLGEATFLRSLQDFYHENRNEKGSWDNLRRSFEKVSGTDLSLFFQERLSRKDIPRLFVENTELIYTNTLPSLSFNLVQKTELPYSLNVPIHIQTSSGTVKVIKKITEENTHITIALKQRPTEFTIDPEYSFLRQLAPEEKVAVWSHFLGSKKKLVILKNESARESYKPVLQTLEKYEPQITTADKVTNSELSQYSLLFLGTNQKPAESLFGLMEFSPNSFILDVRTNPLNQEHVAVLVSGDNVEQVNAAARKLKHYGKYSYLKFQNGRNLEKSIDNSQNGIKIVLEKFPKGSSTTSIDSFAQIVDKLANNRVIYVGENHTSLSDHLLQLRIIEALHHAVPHLAIGMEMFPQSSQAALDEYTLKDKQMSEQTFLKNSRYYDVWRFDFRFFRDIFNYARDKRIPVIGLNLDREVVSQVFQEGNTDGLDKAVLKTLPAERDLDMDGYKERLGEIYSIHTTEGHATGMQSGFIQAQAIWDETMAENVTHFLQTHPDHTMVVLAGSQHTRKDSGIPPRVSRRIAVKQASVLNIYNENAPENLSEITDYYFFSAPKTMPEKPKIGIILNAVKKDEDISHLQIEQFSPHGKAKEAGLREEDILLRVNGVAISSMADLHIAMLDTKDGDKITMDILRSENSVPQELTFTVELTLPKRPPGHP